MQWYEYYLTVGAAVWLVWASVFGTVVVTRNELGTGEFVMVAAFGGLASGALWPFAAVAGIVYLAFRTGSSWEG